MSQFVGQFVGQFVQQAVPPVPAMSTPDVNTIAGRTSASAVRSVVADSGPLLALFNRADRWHTTALAWLQANPKACLITTWPVLTQVCTLLSHRVSSAVALDFLRWGQRGGFTLDVPAVDALPEALANVLLISVRFQDLTLGLAVASVAKAAERLGLRHLLTVDSDFDVYRDSKGKALRHVLRDDWGQKA